MKKIFTFFMVLLAASLTIAQDKVNIEISQANWATYWLEKGLDFSSNSNIWAFKVSGVNENEVELTQISSAGAGDIVIVGGLEGSYQVNIDENAAPLTGNLLKVSETAVVSNGNYYGLKLFNGVVGFYRTEKGKEVPASKGYIVIGGENKPVYGLLLDQTGIEERTISHADGKFYNLQGMEVAHPTRGIYIHNGKKVTVK